MSHLFRRASAALCVPAWAVFAGAALAAPPAGTEVEAAYSRETLDHGLADWQATQVLLDHRYAAGAVAYARAQRTRRFSLDDNELLLGGYMPLSDKWLLQLEASGSNTHRVLPEWSALAQISLRLPAAWGVSLGARRSEYTDSGSRLLLASVENYFGSVRVAYTLYSGRPDGAASAASHRLALDYFYGERSSVGISGSTGRELESVGIGRAIVTDVDSISLTARHWFTPHWAITGELLHHRQGALYTREGARVGIRLRF